MADPFLTPADLAPFATIDAGKATAMIEDATAMAVGVAPCIADSTESQLRAQVKAVLRAAILRWNDAGSGAKTTKQDTTGPFSHQETYDTRTHRSGLFWPDEISTLQGLCTQARKRAFSIDTTPASARAALEAWPW